MEQGPQKYCLWRLPHKICIGHWLHSGHCCFIYLFTCKQTTLHHFFY